MKSHTISFLRNLYESFLAETYINAMTIPEKEAIVDEVWDIIQSSYAPIGGMKASGMLTKQDMIDNIPLWKAVRKNNKIVAVALYKDKGGRKRIAVGTDGSAIGKESLKKIYIDDFDRAYFEVSGASFGVIVKLLGEDFVQKYAKTPEEAQELLKTYIDSPIETDRMYEKFPSLRRFMYSREIGGHFHTKIMLGTSGKKIII